MKHAINELKALLDTWGPQKDASWIRDIEDALDYIQEAQEYLDSDTPVGLSSQVIRKLDARRYEEQHRADMAETNGGSEEQQLTQEQIAQAYAEAAGVPVVGFAQEIDDDLGELDPSAACDLSKEGGCESCS